MKNNIIISIVLLSVGGLAMAAQTTSVSLTDLTKPITVSKSHPDFEVVLSSNATTGYRWFFLDGAAQQHCVVPLGYHYQAPQGHLMGAPGKAVFRFRLNCTQVPTLYHLGFVYMRPWQTSEAKQVQVAVVVK